MINCPTYWQAYIMPLMYVTNEERQDDIIIRRFIMRWWSSALYHCDTAMENIAAVIHA